MVYRRLLLLSATVFSVAALFSPRLVFAATTLFQPIVPQTGSCLCPGSAPDWGCILQVVQNLITTAVTLGVFLCVLWIAYAGFRLMTSGGSPQARSEGKNRILNALLGIVVILCSWLIVDFVMKMVYNPSTAIEGGTFGPWNAILKSNGSDYCLVRNETPGAITNGTVDVLTGTNGSSASGGYGVGAGGGSCSVAAAGACSVAALQGTCFGARAQEASRVCNLESAGGKVDIKSGSDRLNGGSGPSYSIGLWQINLTTSAVGGLNCPAAFTQKCQGSALVGSSRPGACNSSIKDQDLYSKCVAAAQNPTNNNAVACSLYQSRGFQPWSYSSRKCSVPFK